MTKSPQSFVREVAPETRGFFGMIRRMAITLHNAVLWQVLGHTQLDDEDETHEAPVFSGIGFYARPPANGNPEAFVAFPGGGANNPVIIATRDEATRAAAFAESGELAAGETAIFNASAIVVLKADGTIEIRSLGGVALPLATKADIDALKTWASDHIHTAPGGGGPTTTPTVAPPAAAGTLRLKAE